MGWKSRVGLFTYFALSLIEKPSPEVAIEQGVLRGIISKNGELYEYLGIPYATSNIETRFQAPSSPPMWDGVYQAINEHYRCPQIPGLSILITGQEDCLKINVYVPTNRNEPLPVMVYIHGGAFIIGSGGKLVYTPDFITRHNVILVTFNYRLGALGFLCLGIKQAPGNAGLRDQVAALKWVQKNIAAFGGDPSKVTLFGESAGAVSVSLLLNSKAAKGLFHKAIMQSGSSLSHWSINRYPLWTASLLANILGYNVKDPYEIYNYLKNMSYDTLAKGKVLKPFERFLETSLTHLPCVEKSFPGIEPIIPDLTYNGNNYKSDKNIPVMMGFNNKEGLFFIKSISNQTITERNDAYLFASDLEFNKTKEAEVFNNQLKKHYFDNKFISSEVIYNVSEQLSDIFFTVPAMLETEALLESGKTVYNYIFKYSGNRNVVKFLTGNSKEDGAVHGDDMFYLFNARIWPLWRNKRDQRMIDQMTQMWTNFAKYGDPTPKVTDLLPVRWQPSKRKDLKFLYIDEDLEMGSVPNKRAFEIWRDAYSKHRRKQGTVHVDY